MKTILFFIFTIACTILNYGQSNGLTLGIQYNQPTRSGYDDYLNLLKQHNTTDAIETAYKLINSNSNIYNNLSSAKKD